MRLVVIGEQVEEGPKDVLRVEAVLIQLDPLLVGHPDVVRG